MNKIIQKNQNGFTMIEILIGTLLFAIGILGVAIMQISAIKGNSFASGLTEASTLAQDKMEELMMIDYNNPDLNDIDGDGTSGLRDPLPPLPNQPPSPTPAPDYPLPGNPAPPGKYTLCWNVAVDVPGQGVKTIGIVVTWGPQDEYELVRRIAIQSIKAPM